MDKKELQTLLETRRDALWVWSLSRWPKLQKFTAPTIVINARLKVTGARNFSEENLIDFSLLYMQQHTAFFIRQIVPHELAHQIDHNLNGWYKGRKHHNPEWCAIMGAYGLPPDAYLPTHIKVQK